MDYKNYALQFSRCLNGLSIYSCICFLLDPEGSIFYPTEEYSRLDSLLWFLVFSGASTWLFRFGAKVEGSRRYADYTVAFFAVLWGLSDFMPT